MLTENGALVLDYHNCTSKDRELFYDEAEDGEVASIEQDFYELKCLDDVSQVNLLGNVFAEKSNVLALTLSKCTEASNCKSREEISQFISDYYIEIIYNQQNYIPTNFGDDEIIQKRISSYAIYLNPFTPISIINEIQQSTLQSEESLYNFFSTGIEMEWYSVLLDVERFTYSPTSPTVQTLIFQPSKSAKNS